MKFYQNFDLSKYNTMALSSIARQAVILDDESQVEQLFKHEQLTAKQTTEPTNNPSNFLILSGGSNVILPNQLDALVILPRFTGINIVKEDEQSLEIEVMAGNNWHDLVVECTQQGWYGLENLALIPGLVGASPVQNIGAYGVQLEDCMTHVKAFHIPTNSWQILNKDDCEFAYRDSIFKRQANTWLISRVGFRLHKDATRINVDYGDVKESAKRLAEDRMSDKMGDKSANTQTQVTLVHVTPIDVMNAVISIRQSKLPDPAELANTGSFFQNPIIAHTQYQQLLQKFADLPKYDIDEENVKVPAGWLIDKAGLKGKGIAPILTHEKQALVLTNHAPNTNAKPATQADIANTRDLIIKTVFDKYGIKLQPEPVWVN